METNKNLLTCFDGVVEPIVGSFRAVEKGCEWEKEVNKHQCHQTSVENEQIFPNVAEVSVLRRYLALFPVNRLAGMWGKQERKVNRLISQAAKRLTENPQQESFEQRGSWCTIKQAMTDADLLGHLDGSWWLGCRAIGDPQTEAWTSWLCIDIDDKTPGGEVDGLDATERLEQVKAALWPATPLVCSSPSGSGLHVYFRLEEELLLTSLHDGKGTSGPVVDMLRVQGLPVTDGQIEVYPRTNRILRLQNKPTRMT